MAVHKGFFILVHFYTSIPQYLLDTITLGLFLSGFDSDSTPTRCIFTNIDTGGFKLVNPDC